MKNKAFFLLILALGFILRIYGINWDNGFHLHPDERMLIMVADRLHFFNQLNPDFFNYGSLPVYLLKGVTQLVDLLFGSHFSNYNGMLYAGRMLSIVFDLMTICLVYKICLLLFNRDSRLALFSSFFYAIAFFPIQNSHFFVVDVFLTTFVTFLFYLLLHYLSHDRGIDNNYRWRLIVLIGVIFAAMMATKVTAIIFFPIIILALLIFNSRPVANLFCFGVSFLTFNFLFMPYAFIEHKRFLSDVLAQIRMNSDPYIFPYTLQYVGTIPYLYYLKNIFWWGLGPIISILSLVGFLSVLYQIRTHGVILSEAKDLVPTLRRGVIKHFTRFFPRQRRGQNDVRYFLFFIFYFLYFIIIGRSAVKFMRYMLPIYPFLAIMAGFGLHQVQKMSFLPRQRRGKLQQESIKYYHWIPTFVGMTLAMIWTLLFVNIYSQKHTRIAATEWILENIPAGSTLAVEHWDDRVPLFDNGRYKYVELPLYERPDDWVKWSALVNPRIEQADYIIIASNRLYVPLQKLADCQKYKSCYPKTAEYYRKLFNSLPVIPTTTKVGGGISYKKVAEFVVYPTLDVLRYTFHVNDQSADESFTVYDHPKAMVFKKI